MPSGAATFLGALTGSGIGLIAIVIGALFNAHLNRRRDNRLRDADRRAMVVALRAELGVVVQALQSNADRLTHQPPESDGGFIVPDLEHLVQIYPHMLPSVGLLKSDTVKKVAEAYGLVGQYLESLVLIGGSLRQGMPEHRRMVYLPAEHASFVAEMNLKRVAPVKEALDALDGELAN